MADQRQDTVLQLADQLSEGFAALTSEYQVLFDQQRQLESKLSWAKQQYLDLLKRFTPNTLSQDHLSFLQDFEQFEIPRQRVNWVEQLSHNEDDDKRQSASLIRQADTALTRLRGLRVDTGVKIWSGPSADNERPDMSLMEKDFTTMGTPSKLGCPFSATSGRQSPIATPRSSTSRLSFRGSLRGRRSKRPSFTDPIRAEICGNDHVSAAASGSADGSAGVCPIRFLDQHAPEEVAKYFENHKHDLPRSHEVCIKRFQSNSESIQALDRKYGNLVSMIQGLGQKHQEYLPKDLEDELEQEMNIGDDAKADARVEKWAEAVSVSLHNSTPDEGDSTGDALEEGRTAHFDRPMKEIRVGESPSRPWGISIPAKYTNGESSSSVGSAPTASPPLPLKMDLPIGETPRKPGGKCPFDHAAMSKPPQADKPHIADDTAATAKPDLPPRSPEQLAQEPKVVNPEAPKVIPQMVFNGPVFLGYPPDQLISLLQNSNLGGMMR
ncbi:hypothetical protein BDV96DRAFT_491618 [Lophiotrema nucula]|uniref:Uncharacterized protein n=1 Tax=Lophiotrema nucula TaxID=690887 RepID=A0A6A5ZCA2_9PLEO|nr:hypothetical protein BDV96DRAFT_491618 [Lophiotrema nucula]